MRISKCFLVTMAFFLLLSGIWTLCAAPSPQTTVQVQEIDEQITQLNDMKRGYDGRALRHEDLGQNLQFEQRNYLEARRHFELAEENREKARETQKQIDFLKMKRERLLKD